MSGPTVDQTIADYDREAGRLAPRYAALGSERFIARHAALLPAPPGPILDIGAGSGVHAAGLAGRGFRVVAVEPSAGMRREAARLFPGAGVEWVDDRLPDLGVVRKRGERFAFVLVNAVWMHVPPADRDRACAALADLAVPGTVVCMALRQGPPPADRPMHDCDPDTVSAELRRHGFAEISRSEHGADLATPDVTFVRINFRYADPATPASPRTP